MNVQRHSRVGPFNQEHATVLSDWQRWRLLPVVLTGTFMALFDFFVVNVAAPTVQRDLHASIAAIQLVVGGYAFTYAALLITGGRLGDRYGYRRLFMLGMLAFVAASAACGLAQTSEQLIVARLGQGLAAAAMVPQVLALITTLFPAAERSRALAWFGVTIGLGSIAGQVLGGVLLQANIFGLGWRAIFLVNVPVGLSAVCLAAWLVPATRSSAEPRLDPIGVAAISGSLALALIPLTVGREEGWPAWAIGMLLVSLPAIAAAVGYEGQLARRGGQPLLHLELFRQRTFSAGLAISMALYAYFGSFMLSLALFLQTGLRFSALDAGLTFAPVGIAFAVTSLLVRPLIAKHGTRIIAGGLALTAIGLLGILMVVHASGSAVDSMRLVPWFLLCGAGNGCVMPSLVGVVLVGVPAQKAGGAAGTLATSQQFASAIGVAGLGEIFFAVLGAHPTVSRYVSAIQEVLMIDFALVVAGLALTQLLPRGAMTEARKATLIRAASNPGGTERAGAA
jgi:EmrB/QacA subfamily drug resistance transporter